MISLLLHCFIYNVFAIFIGLYCDVSWLAGVLFFEMHSLMLMFGVAGLYLFGRFGRAVSLCVLVAKFPWYLFSLYCVVSLWKLDVLGFVGGALVGLAYVVLTVMLNQFKTKASVQNGTVVKSYC